MKKLRKHIDAYLSSMYKGSYIILIIGLLLINLSLSLITYYSFLPLAKAGDIGGWISTHGAEIFDMVCASISITLIGAWLLDYSYKKDR